MQVVGTFATSGEQWGSMWVTTVASHLKNQPAVVLVSRANDPLSQRKSSDTCRRWPSSTDTNSGLQLSWGERAALPEPERHQSGAFQIQLVPF